MQRLIDDYDYQLKFVVEAREDFAEIGELLNRLTQCRSGAGLDHGAGDERIGS